MYNTVKDIRDEPNSSQFYNIRVLQVVLCDSSFGEQRVFLDDEVVGDIVGKDATDFATLDHAAQEELLAEVSSSSESYIMLVTSRRSRQSNQLITYNVKEMKNVDESVQSKLDAKSNLFGENSVRQMQYILDTSQASIYSRSESFAFRYITVDPVSVCKLWRGCWKGRSVTKNYTLFAVRSMKPKHRIQ